MKRRRNYISIKRKRLPYCIYCSTPFGTLVRYNGKARVLFRVKEHFTPIADNGLDAEANITDACQVCNAVKGSRSFINGPEARNYILDSLLDSDWCIIKRMEPKEETVLDVLRKYAPKE